jgi:hypothetical protein
MTLILDGGLRILFLRFGFEEGDEVQLKSRILRLLKRRRPSSN